MPATESQIQYAILVDSPCFGYGSHNINKLDSKPGSLHRNLKIPLQRQGM